MVLFIVCFIELDCCLGTIGSDFSYSGATIDQSGNIFVTGHMSYSFFGPTIGLKKFKISVF